MSLNTRGVQIANGAKNPDDGHQYRYNRDLENLKHPQRGLGINIPAPIICSSIVLFGRDMFQSKLSWHNLYLMKTYQF